MNQAAFGCMLHRPGRAMQIVHSVASGDMSEWLSTYQKVARGYKPDPDAIEAKFLGLSCAEWNACNDNWRDIPQNGARLVHLKGDLRRALLSNMSMNQVLPPQKYIAANWRGYGK